MALNFHVVFEFDTTRPSKHQQMIKYIFCLKKVLCILHKFIFLYFQSLVFSEHASLVSDLTVHGVLASMGKHVGRMDATQLLSSSILFAFLA